MTQAGGGEASCFEQRNDRYLRRQLKRDGRREPELLQLDPLMI